MLVKRREHSSRETAEEHREQDVSVEPASSEDGFRLDESHESAHDEGVERESHLASLKENIKDADFSAPQARKEMPIHVGSAPASVVIEKKNILAKIFGGGGELFVKGVGSFLKFFGKFLQIGLAMGIGTVGSLLGARLGGKGGGGNAKEKKASHGASGGGHGAKEHKKSDGGGHGGGHH